jgi:hypothetical protein
MKKISIIIAVFILFLPFGVLAQDEGGAEDTTVQNHFGINVLHTALITLISTSLSDTTEYLPIHLYYDHAFTQNWGVAALGFYRLDNDSNFRTNELGFAIGPRFSFDFIKGLYTDCKVGLGYAFGVDYMGADYSRLDLVIEPEVGYTLIIGRFFSLTFGIGLQTLIMITEAPSRSGAWDWNYMGRLSHYYLPVANFSLGVVF